MKFGDYKSFVNHLLPVHWTGSRSVWKLDSELWKESTDMIEKGVWKPFDTNKAIKLKSEKGFYKCKSDDKESLKTSMHGPKWAFCDDIERSCTVLLRRICGIFFLLRKNKFLSPTLVRWALEYAKDQFESIILLSQFKDLGLKGLQELNADWQRAAAGLLVSIGSHLPDLVSLLPLPHLYLYYIKFKHDSRSYALLSTAIFRVLLFRNLHLQYDGRNIYLFSGPNSALPAMVQTLADFASADVHSSTKGCTVTSSTDTWKCARCTPANICKWFALRISTVEALGQKVGLITRTQLRSALPRLVPTILEL
ncbi:hypothetical protein EZV62_016841 [Acer yangbiense]|uniref:DUF629 domain-containing protein n=1 Tax=Acer yangbiense TaxID=1000413 RepID=A0A5C7HS69_9ROSI|nr:hypothetical protein EZV62_016841 [Acer yangbiense]